MNSKLYLIGGGLLAEYVIDIIERSGEFEIAGIFDDTKNLGDEVMGVPIIGGIDSISLEHQHLCCAVGSPKFRKSIFDRFKDHTFPAVVDQTVTLSKSASVENGCIIGPGTVILSKSRIDFGACILTSAIINQNVIIGKYSLIGAGANVANGCKIGEGVHLGLGVNIHLGNDITDWEDINNG